MEVTLKHALAFRDNSQQLLEDAVQQVKFVRNRGTGIYSPVGFPRVGRPIPVSGLRTEPESPFDGQLKEQEAAAISVLLAEAAALAQSFGISFEKSIKLSAVIKLPENGWQGDVIDGFGLFGRYMGIAAGVRQDAMNGEEPPVEGTTLGDRVRRDWWDSFIDGVRADKFELESNVAQAVVGVIKYFAERDIPDNKEGAKTENEVRARIHSQIHGANLASALYLEARQESAKVFANLTDVTLG